MGLHHACSKPTAMCVAAIDLFVGRLPTLVGALAANRRADNDLAYTTLCHHAKGGHTNTDGANVAVSETVCVQEKEEQRQMFLRLLQKANDPKKCHEMYVQKGTHAVQFEQGVGGFLGVVSVLGSPHV